ncbi:MAG: hypothetical protein M1838_002851 [Thelocarpon superellum]|nr:MAG: hypothetical protein M1838_002851 [Thelocarpon superellum]
MASPPPTFPPRKVPIPAKGVDYRSKVVLAPMVRSGELPSRLMALRYGADLVWGPETVDRSMIGCTGSMNPRTSTLDFTRPSSNNSTSLIYRLHPELESKRLIFQLGTASPTYAVQAAHLVGASVAGIDVNAGCPKPFSTSGGMGAALLRTPDLLCEILTTLVKEVGHLYEIGISVKIRLLPEPEMTEDLVRRLCQTGITGLTVHCRTATMRPREKAIREQLRSVATICRGHGVACLMNGDVADRDAALALATEYGVDGGMIATAAESNPSVFRTQAEGGQAPWSTIMREYIETALSVENRYGNTKFLLQHLIPGKNAAHKKFQSARGYVELCAALGLDDLLATAAQVDTQLGIRSSAVAGRISSAGAGVVVPSATSPSSSISIKRKSVTDTSTDCDYIYDGNKNDAGARKRLVQERGSGSSSVSVVDAQAYPDLGPAPAATAAAAAAINV